MSNPVVQRYAGAEASGDEQKAQQLADQLVDQSFTHITGEMMKEARRLEKNPDAMETLLAAEEAVRAVGNRMMRSKLIGDLAEHAKQVRQGIDAGKDIDFNMKRVERILGQATAAGR